MIRQREKKSITWLLVLAIIHLMLIAPGGMVMANSLDIGEPVHVQPMDQNDLVCGKTTQLGLDETAVECDTCSDSICKISCSSCLHAQFVASHQGLQFTPGGETFSDSVTLRLTPFSHPPIPRPPRQHHS